MWFNLLITGFFSLLTDVANASCRPNIVVILADDVGWNDVSYHGSDQIPTRNIDALAYNGVILNQHYVQPLCTPTRAALLTGRYPSNIGMQGVPIWGSERRALPPGELLPQYLKNLGYTTRMVGKWHLGFYKKEFTPIYRGFDSHMGNWNGLTSYYEHIYQDLIPVLNMTKGDEDKCYRDSINWNGGQLSGVDFFRDLEVALDLSGRYVTDVYTEEAVNIIETHNKSTPLFLYLAHVACHAGNAGKLLEAPQHVIDKFSHIIEPNRRTYAAMMWKLDESVGKVVAALEESGMLDNTIIVFLSDNGAPTLPVGVWRNWGSNYPLRGVKSVYWEGGVRSAGVLWSSRLKNTPRVSMQLMHVTDWLPTLYAAAGGSLEDLEGAQLDGVDQWDALVTDGPSNRSQVLLQLDDSRCIAGVRRDNWKLITGGNFNGVFDGYSGDSGETTSNPPYNVSDVLQSAVGEALARVKPPPPVDSILQLRERATVTCPKLTNTVSCDPLVDKSCLFDLRADPCETNNLATTHPDKVQELTALLNNYQATMVPQLNKVYYVDQANPARFNNVWTPWDD